ncbi:hypothetical protein FOA52_003147 [Chlamydomonas sp. UWO 241]|nr:hypothetical protein FOA52_003147 [Chlamydomonas sp. UWO 241]
MQLCRASSSSCGGCRSDRRGSLNAHAQARAPARRSCRAHASSWVLFELDGAVMDLHMDGHRVAFNKAFNDLGYECAQFTPPIYNDLLQSGDGTAEGMVKAYFNCMGWPEFIPTTERDLFTRKICELKCTMMTRMLKKDEVKLRADVAGVITGAQSSGVGVAFIAGTQSDSASEVVDSCLRQLGDEVAESVKVFTVIKARGGAADGEEAPPASFSEALRNAAAREKARSAAEFVASLKADTGAPDCAHAMPPIALGNQILANANRLRVTPEWLAALAAGLGVRTACVLLVASGAGVAEAGCAAGCATAAVPRRMAFQGTFPAGTPKFEGYGPGYATWSRLQALVKGAVPP